MLCDRFHCTPDVARDMDMEVVRMLHIEKMGTKEEQPPEGGEDGLW